MKNIEVDLLLREKSVRSSNHAKVIDPHYPNAVSVPCIYLGLRFADFLIYVSVPIKRQPHPLYCPSRGMSKTPYGLWNPGASIGMRGTF